MLGRTKGALVGASALVVMAGAWARGSVGSAGSAPQEQAQRGTYRGPEGVVPPPPVAPPPTGGAWSTAVEPKPLGTCAQKALAWIAAQQRTDGGWNQGEQQGRAGEEVERSNVADTCVAALALARAGSTPRSGPHAEALARALEFVCTKVEQADEESLWVSDVRGTRVQTKIGTYVDTFLASLLLDELGDSMPDERSSARVAACAAKVLRKIARHQGSNGAFQQAGWAPVLSQSLAGKALQRAAQRGKELDPTTLAEATAFFAGSGQRAGDAGVSLYAGAARLGALQESVNTAVRQEGELKDRLAKAEDAEERKTLREALDALELGRRSHASAREEIVARLDDEDFVAGFGSNGGEEFLSYMNISESLVLQGDEAWLRWDRAVGESLARVQNEDGSWTGQHCITGRTFCTASALLVLLADRTPFPVEVLAQAHEKPSAR